MGPPPGKPVGSAGMDQPPPHAVRSQLNRILDSPDFKATAAQRAFLEFVVQKTLSGQAHEIKGYNVATQVFGRHPDFDQATDPIVSIQANKLRRALEFYFLKAGCQDPIHIEIPKGTYVPTFISGKEVQAKGQPHDDADYQAENVGKRPVLLVQPFKNLSGNGQEFDFWGVGLASELTVELTRYPDIQVLKYRSSEKGRQEWPKTVDFIISGSVLAGRDHVKVTVQLTNTATGVQIWGDSHKFSMSSPGLIRHQEALARRISVIIAGERGLVTKTLAAQAKRDVPKRPKAYEALLRYYEYDLKGSAETFLKAFTALQDAVTIEPDYGQNWCLLAKLYADIYALDMPGEADSINKAFECAARGIRLAPDSKRSRVIMTYIHLLRDDLAAGIAEIEQALVSSPETLFIQDGVGYLLTLMGEWDRGTRMIHDIIRLNPHYGNYVHFALWLNYLRKEEYSKSYQEALKLNNPNLFWDHLARAASLGLLNETAKGQVAAGKLLELKPDFPERGKTLIKHFIKFDQLVARTIEGLQKVGVEVT